MNSRPVPDDVLSAYLADDLPDGEAAALEARLPGDPELAGRLDRMAEVLVELGGLDHATPPSGFDARLAQRLRTERAEDRSADTARLAPAPAADLGSARRQRAARQRRWLIGGSAAAAVAAVALVSGLALQQLGGSAGGGAGAEDQGAAGPASRAAEREGGSGEDAEAAQEHGQTDAQATESAPRSAPTRTDRPVVLDREVVLADEAAVRDRYRALVEAERLLAAPLPQARAAADDAAAFLRRSPPLRDGVAPAECLPALQRGSATPVVPVRVETVVYRDEPALAYVLVAASDGARELDGVVVEILRAEDCSTALRLRL